MKSYNSSYHRIFKYIGFVPSHYVSVINLNTIPSFNVFSESDYVSQYDVIKVQSIKLFVLNDLTIHGSFSNLLFNCIILKNISQLNFESFIVLTFSTIFCLIQHCRPPILSHDSCVLPRGVT